MNEGRALVYPQAIGLGGGRSRCRVHFLSCSMATSVWRQTRAGDAWFWGSLLRGVDFGDTEWSRAVFADADVAGTQFRPEHIIGADFRGTVRGIRGGG